MNERFAKVREILSEPPSEETWTALLAELRAWPAFDDKELGLEYIHAHLDKWPDELRALNQLTDSPYWRFVRCYHIDRKMRNPTLCHRLKSDKMLRNINVLRISVGGNINSAILAIFTSPRLKQLHTLILEGRSFGPGHVDFINTAFEKYAEDPSLCCDLKKLVLRDVGSLDDAFPALAKLPGLAGLEAIELARLPDVDDLCNITETLFEKDVFPQLKEVTLRECGNAHNMLDAYARSPAREHIEVFNIVAQLPERSCPWYPMLLEGLLEERGPSALRRLNLVQCSFSEETIEELLSASHLGALTIAISEGSFPYNTLQMLNARQRQDGYVGPTFVW